MIYKRGRETEDERAGAPQVPAVTTAHVRAHPGMAEAEAQAGARPGGGGEERGDGKFNHNYTG